MLEFLVVDEAVHPSQVLHAEKLPLI